MRLPRRLANTRNHTFVGIFTETNTAQPEIAHETMTTTTLETAVYNAGTKFWRLFGTRNNGCLCHID